jgi:hypothetical protein
MFWFPQELLNCGGFSCFTCCKGRFSSSARSNTRRVVQELEEFMYVALAVVLVVEQVAE